MRRDLQKLLAIDEEAAEELEEAEEIEAEISSPRRWSQGLVVLLGALGVQRLASFAPELIERFYSNFFYLYTSRIVALVNKPFSISLSELGLILLAIGLFVWLLWLIQKVWNGFLTPLDFLGFLLYRSIWVGGALFLAFLVAWGFNYHRQPLAQTLGWQSRETRPGELEAICGNVINRLNQSYDQARANLNWAADSKMPLTKARLYEVLEQSYQGLTLLGDASRGGYGPPKPLMFSPMLSRFGVSGVYSPFTGEANFNEEVPASDLPFVVAHEKAHQRGYAREDEANFAGFLACVNATDPFVQYSGYLHAVPRVMNVLATTNEAEYAALAGRIGAGARTDLQNRAAFWRMRESRVLGELARQTNDTYLKANRVRSGIANYDEVTALIINYLSRYPNGLRAAPAATPPPAPAARPSPTAAVPTPTPVTTPTPAPADPGRFIP